MKASKFIEHMCDQMKIEGDFHLANFDRLHCVIAPKTGDKTFYLQVKEPPPMYGDYDGR